DGSPIEPNVTGKTSVSGFLVMVELIAKHLEEVSSIILRLFQSAIAGRSKVYAEFQANDASFNPDIEEANASHKYFIDSLTKAFKLLGGDEWKANADAQSQSQSQIEDLTEESMQELLFQNKFSALSLNSEGDAGSDSDDSTAETIIAAAPKQRAQKKSTKGKKKGKNGKKAAPKVEKGADLDFIPIESCRIIESKSAFITEYLMATYALASLWTEVRTYIQGVWREVAYEGLNSAVAGALSNMAVAMVKNAETAIFIDFPGHEAYETVTKTITRDDPGKAQGLFSMSLHDAPGHDPHKSQPLLSISLYHNGRGPVHRKMYTADIDVREQLMMHTYADLVDFITDLQKTRSGKPTKRMLAELKNWDPDFDLQSATPDQRIKWRRAYTIKWLCDLVTVFTSIVVERNTTDGAGHILEDVDWSPTGPWNIYQRVFGLDEFAGFVTSLALQKPGKTADVGKRIFPRHVFQLQTIVDAFTVSRG
ncbi:hypothetical protein IMZ48_09500, partial [Candidatus Bathyarchaeota archaeon]|nr:hypothetical protein [Candidatus Bathyarchaeota archaeon]